MTSEPSPSTTSRSAARSKSLTAGLLLSAFVGRNSAGIGLFDGEDGFSDCAQGAATPVCEHHASGRNNARTFECVVLRIDNVPSVRIIIPMTIVN